MTAERDIVIAHLSDLHFGTVDPVLADALAEQLHELAPRLTVISGDFTQRARGAQFAAAREYRDRLPRPQLVVPGNHDIPLYDVLRRAFAPMERYRTYISRELDVVHLDDDLAVLGLNTTRPYRWKEGAISPGQVELIRSVFRRAAPAARRVLVTHHPFVPPPGRPGLPVVAGQGAALPVIREAGVELLLAGHLHLAYAELVTGGPDLLSAQAGTALSHRQRGEANGYGVVRLAPGQPPRVEVRVWDGRTFAPAPARPSTYSMGR